MFIVNLSKIKNAGDLKAVFDIEWPGKLILRDFKLFIDERNNLWSKPPIYKYDSKGNKIEAHPVSILSDVLMQKITDLARIAYSEK